MSAAPNDPHGDPGSGDRFTWLLEAAAAGEAGAADELLPLVYEQLRAVARQRMAGERSDHTLQPTALVHEAFLRIVGDRPEGWSGRAQFFAAAAEAMRRILIEHARARDRIKRGGGRRAISMDVLELAAAGDSEEILALDEAIRRVGDQDERMGQIVRLRFYAGLSVKDTAEVLDLSERTVKREWSVARAWLYRELTTQPGE
jgi:RNA polymerase sigma factor (TIGR02999 family)